MQLLSKRLHSAAAGSNKKCAVSSSTPAVGASRAGQFSTTDGSIKRKPPVATMGPFNRNKKPQAADAPSTSSVAAKATTVSLLSGISKESSILDNVALPLSLVAIRSIL